MDKVSPAKTFDMTPEEVYALVIAALDVVGSVSASTHRRIRTAGNNSDPIVRAWALVALVDALDRHGDGMATRMIATLEAERRANSHG